MSQCTNEKQTELYIECEESHRNIAKEVERIEKSTELQERWSDMSLASTLRSDGVTALKKHRGTKQGLQWQINTGEEEEEERMQCENAHRQSYNADEGFHRNLTWDAPQTGQWEHGSHEEGDEVLRTVGLTERAVKVCKSAACAGENEYDERMGKGRHGCTEQRSNSVTGLDSEEMRGK